MNLAVVSGRIAAPADHRVFDSGAQYLRVLVTVRTPTPRARIDVLPVTLWDPPADVIEMCRTPGHRVWVVGSVQRRFWAGDTGRQSRLEFVARHIEPHPEPASDDESIVE